MMAQKGITVGDVFAMLTGKFDSFSKAISTASEEAVKSTVNEISSLKQLISIAQDEAQSKEVRFAAVKKLQDLYPAYFGNMTQEQIMTQNLTGVTNELTEALINKAIAEKLVGAAVEPTLRLYQANARLLKQKKEQEIAQNQLNEAVKRGDSAQSLAFYSNQLKKINDNLEDTRSEIIETTAETQRLQKSINALGKKSGKLLIEPPKIAKTKIDKVFDTPQVDGIPALIIPAPIIDVNGIKVFNGQVDEFGNKIKELPGIISTNMQFVSGTIVTPLTEEMIAAQEALFDFNVQMNEVIQGAVVDTLSGLGELMGKAMSGTRVTIEDVGATVLGAFGSLLTTLGQMMIQMGVKLLLAKIALKSLNPYLAIAGGVALVAIGSAFGSQVKSLGGGGGGGGSTGGVSTSGGSSGGFSSSGGGGFSGGSNGGTVVFEISGTSLIGVLNNTQERNLRIGGR
jgi:Rps23 Pro-64 3,4-dihydroxylase Tpa1-like proline 4-hydroxylase